jgi:hypothetical protein
VQEFEEANLAWLNTILPHEPFVSAMEAKTRSPGLVADGIPVQLVTVLIDKLKIVIARRTLRDDATNDSCVL